MSNPFLGSLTIAAALVHWKPIIVLSTSDKKGVELTEMISTVMPPIEHSVFLPIAAAFLFSTGYPVIKAIISLTNTVAKLIEVRADNTNLRIQKVFKYRESHFND